MDVVTDQDAAHVGPPRARAGRGGRVKRAVQLGVGLGCAGLLPLYEGLGWLLPRRGVPRELLP